MIKIELTEDDALLFRAFKEHQENFSILLARGVFDVRSGKALLNLDEQGVVSDIKLEITSFKRGYPQSQFLYTTPQKREELNSTNLL
jgi:hypothetical protein